MSLAYLSSIHEQGFAIIPGIFLEQEVNSVLERASQRTEGRSRAGIRHALRYPEIAELAQDQRLIELASEMLGENSFPYRATLFDKSPRANWLVVWHQDTSLPLVERFDTPGWGPWSVKEGVIYAHAPATALSRIIALRVHLDDSTEENGPLRVLPGTHQLGVLTDEQIEQQEKQVRFVSCTALRGDILAMRPLIIHSSCKARRNSPRRVLHIEYARHRKIADGLELAVT
jgi:ectoine hydroxylase-related dioxygenase (phytanoyl-CoA dioxygenase family)